MIPVAQPPFTEIRNSEVARKWIGDATMEEDGTIRIRIRMEDHGLVGEALHRYKPSDPDYAKVLAHLPGLKPGVFVSVYDDWD